MALGDHRAIKTPNNQPKVSRSGREYVIDEADRGGECGRGHHPIVWGKKLNDEKIYNDKYIVAFGSLH